MRVIHKSANPLSGFQTGEFTGFLHRCSQQSSGHSLKTRLAPSWESFFVYNWRHSALLGRKGKKNRRGAGLFEMSRRRDVLSSGSKFAESIKKFFVKARISFTPEKIIFVTLHHLF